MQMEQIFFSNTAPFSSIVWGQDCYWLYKTSLLIVLNKTESDIFMTEKLAYEVAHGN